VTTHYTELKVFAHITEGLENASFDFDPRTLTPTYHMILGVPGGSNAIATASHFGIPEEVVSLARASLSQENQELEPLLLSLQEEKQQLESLNKELDREKNAFERHNEVLSAELGKLREERQAMIRAARDEIVAEVGSLQKEINRASSDLKKETSKAALSGARETSHQVRERINQGIFGKTEEVPSNETNEITVGDRVWLRDYDVKGKVTAINLESDQVEVTAGALRFRVKLDEVAKTQGGPTLEPIREVRLHASAKEVSPELDLRGKRAEEIEPLLDSYLSDAAVAKRSWVRIIHGFGTGAVRSIVRDIASRHPLAKSYKGAEQNEGGDGATIITLR
jgi:DNA mismatch repair protein MutS2